jgi:hypothetical protein
VNEPTWNTRHDKAPTAGERRLAADGLIYAWDRDYGWAIELDESQPQAEAG